MKKYLLDDFEFSQSFLFYFDKVRKNFNNLSLTRVESARYEFMTCRFK